MNVNNKTINIKENRLLYPMWAFVTWVVSSCISCSAKLLSSKYGIKLSTLSNNQSVNNVVGLTIFNAIGGLFVLMTQVKLANVLGTEIYGLYSYYIAIGEIGSNFVRYGRHKTMVRDLIRSPEESNRLIVQTIFLSLCNIVVFLVCIIVFHTLLRTNLTWAYVILCLAPCLMSIDFQPVYEAIKLPGWNSLYYLIQKILFLTFVWIAIGVNTNISLLYVGIVLFTSWIVVVVLQYWEICRQFTISFVKTIHIKDIFELYKKNFLIAASCMMGVFFGPYIRLILMRYVDAQAVGVYSAGLQIFLLGQFLMNQISRVGNPRMAEVCQKGYDVVKRKLFIKKYTTVMLLAALPVSIPMICFPSFVTTALFSSEYQNLASQLPILAIYLIVLAIGVVFTQFLISMRKDKLYFTIYIFGALLTIPTGLILIPSYGVGGAIITLCLPHGLSCIGYYLFSIKHFR